MPELAASMKGIATVFEVPAMESVDLPQRVERQQTDKGYVPVYTTAVVEQPWDSYSAADHDTWATLFTRQFGLLQGRACQEFLDALEGLEMTSDRITKFRTIK